MRHGSDKTLQVGYANHFYRSAHKFEQICRHRLRRQNVGYSNFSQPQSHLSFCVLLQTLKQMLRDFIGIRVNRAKKSGMVNITSSVNSRERSGINTILHELNPLFTINVTMRDIKSKNVYSRV